MKAIAVAHLRGAPDTTLARAHALLAASLPRVGVLDEGLFACDLRGTARLLGDARAAGRRVLVICEQAGARTAVGVAGSPFVARVVAERAGDGEVRVLGPDARVFLAPLPVAVLPLDPHVLDELALLGIRETGAFAALDPGAVLDRFGHAAAAAHALARGEDASTVHGAPPRRRIRARRRWDDPIASHEQLVFALRAVADEVAAGLAADGLAALRLVLRLEREGSPLTLERALLPPTAEAAALVRSLRWALEEWAQLGRVTGASLEVSEAEPLRGRQLGLFAPDGAHAEEALAVAAQLRAKLGSGVVLRARVVDAEARVPEREAEWDEVVA